MKTHTLKIAMNEMEMLHFVKSADNSRVVEKILAEIECQILEILEKRKNEWEK